MSTVPIAQMRSLWRKLNGITVEEAETLSELRQALEEREKASPAARELRAICSAVYFRALADAPRYQ